MYQNTNILQHFLHSKKKSTFIKITNMYNLGANMYNLDINMYI